MCCTYSTQLPSIQWLTQHRYSYPKHVWSPAGGWYAQPANWRVNTAIMGGVVIGVTAMAWSVSADREHRHKMPEVRTHGDLACWRVWSAEEEDLTQMTARSILPITILVERDSRARESTEGSLRKIIGGKEYVIYGVHGMLQDAAREVLYICAEVAKKQICLQPMSQLACRTNAHLL